jgi:ABC-type multidrug transport system fused ATPase/permease subunit
MIELLAVSLLMIVFCCIIFIKGYQIKLFRDPNLLGLCLNWMTISTEWLTIMLFQYQELNSGVNCVERLVEMTIPVKEEPSFLSPKPQIKDWPQHGEIVMNKVNIRYREGLPLVLKDISVKFASREKVGIIGRTGSGKSTMILALKRILEVEPDVDSYIMVGGARSDSMGIKYYRSAITLIPQDPFLLSGTIRSNIDSDNRYSDEEVEAALQETQIFSNISASLGQVMGEAHQAGPAESLLQEQTRLRREVLNFEVKDGGVNLSQGQRQLLCIARALIARPKILLMDEATANIDSKSDQIIQRLIKSKFSDSTVITIAHRLNTIIQYDRVVVMSDGQVVEQGSPGDLLEREGMFRDLVMELGEENFEKMRQFAADHSLDPVLD